MMKILVCFKVVPAWEKVLEKDWRQFAPDTDVSYAGTQLNCFDESALELALRLKAEILDGGGQASCTAVTVAPRLPASFAQSLYAVGFDAVLNIADERTEFCPERVAGLLAGHAMSEGYHLILAGAVAGMADTGAVPFLLAGRLGLPALCDVQDIKMQGAEVRAVCQTRDGLCRYTAALPLVAAVGNTPAVLRAVSLKARLSVGGRGAERLTAQTDMPCGRPPVLHPVEGGRACRMPASEESVEAVLEAFRGGFHGARGPHEPDLPGDAVYYGLDGCLPHQYEALLPRLGGERLVLLPDTGLGRLLAARLAMATGRAYCTGAKRIQPEPDGIRVEKRVCAGNLARTETLKLPAVLTVRTPPRGVRYASPAAPEDALPNWVISCERPEGEKAEGPDQAEKLVICGAGIGSAAACRRARLLAEKLGAGFGLTRPAALNGWGTPAEIVGQSGVSVSPKVCLVLGASGAGAFLAGLETAGSVIAVNTDPDALIFRHADIGIRADAPRFVEQMLNALAEGG